MEPQTVADKKADLESALMGFPDKWDMVETIADAFVNMVRFRPRPEMRKLAEGEEYSSFEKEGFAGALVQWTDEHEKIKGKYESALKMMADYEKAKKELVDFGKRK